MYELEGSAQCVSQPRWQPLPLHRASKPGTVDGFDRVPPRHHRLLSDGISLEAVVNWRDAPIIRSPITESAVISGIYRRAQADRIAVGIQSALIRPHRTPTRGSKFET